MKQKYSFLMYGLFLFSYLYGNQPALTLPPSDPLLVIVIMVKNEELVIKKTLEPYCKEEKYKNQIAYFVYDTGLDKWSPTMQKAQELFSEYSITNYKIAQEPFIDFATSRNKALRLAEAQFPNATFLLMPDAEWYLSDVPVLMEFCQQHKNELRCDSYFMRIISSDLDFYVPRLIRAHTNACFEGVVHECLQERHRTGYGPATTYFEYPKTPLGLQASKQRWIRDKNLLFNEYVKNPKDARNLFYLAQTCHCLLDYESAIKFYTERTLLTGFDEEDYMAHFRAGMVVEELLKTSNSYQWPHALHHYLTAYMMRPNRAEPLIKIALYYFNNKVFDAAFLYAYVACQVPYPADVLFVEKEMYERIRYEVLSKALPYAKIEIAKENVQKICKQYKEQEPLENFFLTRAFGI